ncbi:hypothetical protein QA648_32835 (plasmid) [Rhizobium sp. CB3171]|uniref:hypothetical protein n=1 Tax=Rhizobium sp. CB3171 TaxID=3039157 RepID=UPI0024B1622D|nr:hypothetical protein [Rhizobium sp. CB3171]WFU06999.1 hypothetical protein QA648_32835 [Rhizobium sp. CB3171]
MIVSMGCIHVTDGLLRTSFSNVNSAFAALCVERAHCSKAALLAEIRRGRAFAGSAILTRDAVFKTQIDGVDACYPNNRFYELTAMLHQAGYRVTKIRGVDRTRGC